jgi:hypothetical protein
MKRSQRFSALAGVGTIACLMIGISRAFANEPTDHPADTKTGFAEVVIGRHMFCVNEEEILMRNLASYQKVMTGKTIDETGATVRTDAIYVDPTTREVVIVGINLQRDTFCITDVFINVRVRRSEVLDTMENEPPVK